MVLFISFSCITDDSIDRSFEELPELTTTGADLMAFKHESETYVDQRGLLDAYYQLDSTVGPVLLMAAEWEDREIIEIIIGTTGVEIEEGMTIPFGERIPDFAFFTFFYKVGGNGIVNSNSSSKGSLTITHLDNLNNIVSGTFNTEIIHPKTGKTIRIRDGRFDTFFRR